jgi:MYXO-CTERM domain-containing protein
MPDTGSLILDCIEQAASGDDRDFVRRLNECFVANGGAGAPVRGRSRSASTAEVANPSVDPRYAANARALALAADGGSRVLDGEPVPKGMVLDCVAVGSGTQWACTGTLIAPTVVLTAAHCIDSNLGGDALVGFTLAHDTRSAAPTMTATLSSVQHESFDVFSQPDPGLTQWFDIGLVILAEPVTEVAPIKMPRPDDAPNLLADADLSIVGYGRTSNQTQETGVMHDATTKLVSLNQWELQVAGGGGQPQNCHGDSGGPALAELGGTRVVGVVSRSFDLSPQCLNGGIDTRVDAYLDWIFAQMPPGVPCGSGLAEPCAEDEDEGGGCCSTSREAPAGSLVVGALVFGMVARRRRRR